VKTDTLFYQLFQNFPSIFFEFIVGRCDHPEHWFHKPTVEKWDSLTGLQTKPNAAQATPNRSKKTTVSIR